jgi:hypothetical protein
LLFVVNEKHAFENESYVFGEKWSGV